eukprot:TRINITY_DN1609_c7_g1_i1.p1 TRINITY_DN1609_c7_g1~~TRINITY_DN1609_c7_g1_i1.p1  ORF type:complete len:343 (+),score=92.93 TRINITY_DN1609_c7_g1_i1:29-1030(+)
MRAVIGMAFLVVGAGASGCGNCDYMVDGRIACNTGGSDTKVPFPSTTDVSGANSSVIGNGTSTAQVATVAEVKAAVGSGTWTVSFCGSYLDRYTDGAGSLPGEGAICVRDFSTTSNTAVQTAFTQADNEAKALFNMFGTTNGYKSSFAVTKGGISLDTVRWGTGRSEDVTANWCGVYMKEMLCSIAFPQIAVDKATVAASIAAGRTAGATPYTAQSTFNTTTNTDDHYIRWVERDSCDTLFEVCNRREPTTDEKKDEFTPEIMNNQRARLIFGGTTKSLESDAFCSMWEQGFGIGQAGTALGGGNLAAVFEASTTTTFSALLSIASVLVVLML